MTIAIPEPKDDKEYAVVVDGKVRITDEDFNDREAPFVLIAKEITFDKEVVSARGLFIANIINIEGDPSPPKGLKIKGNLVALEELNLDRRGENFNRAPSLFIVFDIKPYIKLLKYISTSKVEFSQID